MIFLINNWQETHQNTNSRGIIRDLFPFLCFSSMHSKTTSVSPHTLGGGLVTQLYPTLVIPWTVTCQAPLSIRFSRQEYRSGLPFPSPEDLPDSGIEPASSALQAVSCIEEGFFTAEPPGKPTQGREDVYLETGLCRKAAES